MKLTVLRLVAVLSALSIVASACSAAAGSVSTPSNEIVLNMSGFGASGFEPMLARWEREHPGVRVQFDKAQFDDHHITLRESLDTRTDVPDIAMVEIYYLSEFTDRPLDFYDLRALGADEMESDYLDWRWQHGVGPDGEVVGIPTDIGGMALAYRTDLLAEAGLPTDRKQLEALWSSWDAFIDSGITYTEATGRAFIADDGEMFEAMVNQGPELFVDEAGDLNLTTDRSIARAWDLAAAAASQGLSADLVSFTEPWNEGMSAGDYAVLMAPAWMMSYIQQQAPDTAGLWDITAMPEGGGNWGGSQLVIPAESAHPELAWDLLQFLLSPATQLEIFLTEGNFPSTPELYELPDIRRFTKPFFNNAPVGVIYSDSALALEPRQDSAHDSDIMLALREALATVGTADPAARFDEIAEELLETHGGHIHD